MRSIEVLDPNVNVIITGQHLPDKSDANVGVVRILNSNTPFVIPQIFSTFANLHELEVYSSQLRTLRIPPTANLDVLEIRYNNITRINRGDINHQTNLVTLTLFANEIEEIDEFAFDGLLYVSTIGLINNRISHIQTRTFFTNMNARVIDLEGNRLTSIGIYTFTNTRQLRTLYLERNQISEIHPEFTQDLSRNNLTTINLSGNQCVSRSFLTNDDFSWSVVNLALQPCFTNFVGGPNETRRVSFEFTGNLTLQDQFGNVVARF